MNKFIYIESLYSDLPVSGFQSTGRNGYYYCYKSNNSYPENMAKAIMNSIANRLPSSSYMQLFDN